MSRRWLQRESIHAVHKRDLESVLRDLGLLENLQAGLMSCVICGNPLTIDSVQCLFLREDQIGMCCTNTECYQTVLSLKEIDNQ